MKITIEVDIDLEESEINQDEAKDNIVDFTKNLLTNCWLYRRNEIFRGI